MTGPSNELQALKAEFFRAMAHPMLYLFSGRGAGVTGRRFVAAHWNPNIPPEQAAFIAGAPAGWPELAKSPVWPGGRPSR